jgi:uncharacterized protein YndB with AHSA1/START domain
MSALPPTLPHSLDRTVVIRASPETVFRFFTDSERWAKWWGAGSSIDPRPGGTVVICYPGGTKAGGEVIDVSAPERIVFTYGYASGAPIPLGGSRVTISVEASDEGCRVHLHHELADAGVRDEHIQGWRYQLSLFGNVVTDESNAWAQAAVDLWFDGWSEPDEVARRRMFAEICVPSVRFRDRYGNLDSVDELVAHAGAAQRFMPGIRMRRRGNVMHCQGTVLVDWVATGLDGAERAVGSSVFTCAAHGRFEAVTGFAKPA